MYYKKTKENKQTSNEEDSLSLRPLSKQTKFGF